MGRRHRLQLLKPNYVPIDCTAEVVNDGLHLLRINGKMLFRFDFEKIHNFSCTDEDKLELEVHMGSGKMGKVKLQADGQQIMGASPIQGLHSDLRAAFQMHPSKALQGNLEGPSPHQPSPPPSINTISLDSASEGYPSMPVSPHYGSHAANEGQGNVERRGSTQSSPTSPEATSLPSSSGTWGPGRRPATGA
eukprot:CAMPEP_0117688528 /NCGR_PEP_ID=MMETSP0804-20121206/23893_1 /TAXON_ID=1074897 /ORGANISM="Tetraselmis astigmatica, Strain CCMP880" /LENGTH=191 /DNA_ID=CAMNT_0005501017 /DNA_START=252 /DNA_END=823 /DNA_ORIENTATION=-